MCFTLWMTLLHTFEPVPSHKLIDFRERREWMLEKWDMQGVIGRIKGNLPSFITPRLAESQTSHRLPRVSQGANPTHCCQNAIVLLMWFIRPQIALFISYLTTLFNNMQNLKFKSPLTVALFAAVNYDLNICKSAINGPWKTETSKMEWHSPIIVKKVTFWPPLS